MNEESQKRQILQFLRGKYKQEVTPFSIYQWIELYFCHKWWELGVALACHIPPNSLDLHFHKRLDYLLLECQRNAKERVIFFTPEKKKVDYEYAYKTKLQVPIQEAERLIDSINNKKFLRAKEANWVVDENGNVRAQSILWLYCWAKTGMGSKGSAIRAQEVFDALFPFRYALLDARIDHEWARKMRYSSENIEEELDRLVG